MANVKFKLNRAGVRELLMSDAMRSIIEEKAKAVERSAGEGYTAEITNGTDRVYAHIHAETPEAFYENQKHNTLLKALGSGKG